MNQSRTKPIVDAVRLELSMKMTDSPGAIVVIPLRGTEAAKLSWLSSILQPVISTAVAPPFVTSNQSSAKGLSPLDHGATSEIKREEPSADGRRAARAVAKTMAMMGRMFFYMNAYHLI